MYQYSYKSDLVPICLIYFPSIFLATQLLYRYYMYTYMYYNNMVHSTLHYRARWAADEKRDMCLQLDPTEGPQRVRRRMMRAPTTVHEKHLLPKAAERRKNKKNGMMLMKDYHLGGGIRHVPAFLVLFSMYGLEIVVTSGVSKQIHLTTFTYHYIG